MSRKWPPSPSVEDEQAALAREHDLNAAIHRVKSEDDPPAEIRGSVDQYPIILEVNVPPDNKPRRKSCHGDKDDSLTEGQSGDESSGPGTPPPANSEKRFIFMTRREVETTDTEEDRPRRSSRSGNLSRGRPVVAPIRTDVGSDLPEMVTGQRRVPSPYAYQPSQPERYQASKTSGTLLSPRSGQQPRKEAADGTRSGSAKPKNRRDDSGSSTDSSLADTRRHHSQRRSVRNADSSRHQDAEIRPRSRDGDKPSSARVFQESPYASAAEDARRRSRQNSYSLHHRSRDSPHTSSAEEANTKRHDQARTMQPAGSRSPRGSLPGTARPPIELSEDHYSYGAGDFGIDEPTSKAPRSGSRSDAVVDVEAAYRRNISRGPSRGPRPAAYPSPFASPARTPPRTPQGDHKHRDYFDLLSASSPGPRQHSRHPSTDEHVGHDHKNHAAAAAAAVAAAAVTTAAAAVSQPTPKPVPNLSRSSTASFDATSSGGASKPAGGQRSRRSSPVYDDQRPVSRTGSYGGAGSSTSTVRGQTQPSGEKRSTPTLPDPPRPAQRAYSYSPTVEHTHPRPPPLQRMSAVNLTPLTPTNPLPNTAASHPARSPISSQSMPLPSVPRPEPAVTTLPPCPRNHPVAGLYDWYTISGVPNIDICPTCMHTLGGTVLRNHFVPSPPKPKYQPVMCSMSRPWVRVALLQILKRRMKESEILELLSAVTNIPPTTKPCPGKHVEARRWWRLRDPSTKSHVPNFEACTDCVRRINLIFPQLPNMFERAELAQEKQCDLTCQSKRFHSYINRLDKLLTDKKNETIGLSDTQPFVDFAWRLAQTRECERDATITLGTWHFIDELPEFTICEECFYQFVWPLRELPVARLVNKAKKLPPAAKDPRRPEDIKHSCQLYSDRMRSIFVSAVRNNDFGILMDAAKMRRRMELQHKELHELYEQDEKRGLDRTVQIRKNAQAWKNIE